MSLYGPLHLAFSEISSGLTALDLHNTVIDYEGTGDISLFDKKELPLINSTFLYYIFLIVCK